MTESIYAPISKRLLAFILDIIILLPIYFILQFLMTMLLAIGIGQRSFIPYLDILFIVITFTMPAFIIFMIQVHFVVSRWQATPGKRIMSIFIGHVGNGVKISKLASFFRILLRSIILILFPLGLSVIFTDQIIKYFFSFDLRELIDLFGNINYTIVGICLMLPAILSIILAIFSKTKLTIYDLLCGSRVFNGKL